MSKNVAIDNFDRTVLSFFKLLYHFISKEAVHNTYEKEGLFRQAPIAGTDPGFFSGGCAPLRNGVIDW